MNRKSKRIIIILVTIFVLAVVVFIAQSVISNNSATVVKDLRIRQVVGENQVDVFDKEVYLSSEDENKFEVVLDYGVSSGIRWTVNSSDTSVAKAVSVKGRTFIIEYYKAGKTTITAHPVDSYAIKDSFVLTVKENYPTNFVFDDLISDSEEKYPNSGYTKADEENEISIYADTKEYTFHFKAEALNEQSIVNNGLLVVDDYDKNIFDNVEIDPVNSTLTIKTKSEVPANTQVLTIQCKKTEENKEEIIDNFQIFVNVKGYYIEYLQAQISETPNFEDGIVYIIGEGPLQDGEVRIDNSLYLMKDVADMVYMKVRGVYTNGDYLDLTTNQALGKNFGLLSSENIGGYIIAYVVTTSGSLTTNISMEYGVSNPTSLQFSVSYSESILKELKSNLYKKVEDASGNVLYYEYNYWDMRFKRNDEITVDGKIVEFINGEADSYPI